MEEGTIALEPPRGWGCEVGYSPNAMGQEWLDWLEHNDVDLSIERDFQFCEGVRVLHADGKCGEDIFLFNDCLQCGCKDCFKKRNLISRKNPDRCVEALFQARLREIEQWVRHGFRVTQMWKCEWEKKLREEDPAPTRRIPRLNPRDAFFGGRTGATNLYRAVDEARGEKIRYVDVTSEYPWANKEGTFPIGHPQVIYQPQDQDISSYYGVALVRILPPENLFHPVLPYRHSGKLLFPLCRACVEEEIKKPMLDRTHVCTHAEWQRALTGTWSTIELEQAVALGYRILHIQEVHHFPPEQRRKGLFKDYVDVWLKDKQESGGWPDWATDEEKRARYLREYEIHEGIKLDPSKIQKNPGKRSTAKLMLNSFWGKFGERTNKRRTKQIHHAYELFEIIDDPLLILHEVRILAEDNLEVVYSFIEEEGAGNNRTNIYIAIFTTAIARLKLYGYLSQLGEQVLYYDTDSVIYVWSPGSVEIPLGDYLGDMTDELEGDYIEEFVSGGAKNYGYRTHAGKSVCKVRGFSLNVRGSKQLNFDVLKQNILDEINHPLDERRETHILNPHHFTRNPTTKQLKTVEQVKRYGLVFDKRVLQGFKSFPYGYCKWNVEDESLANILCNL